ncbi:polyketide cyclase/dehydrase/lipid transport protein [Nocardia tenerifensis]|uniref:Polyketide cyclase/dehydrase/lipid transport protein n=1 Tax=Nocardia tenerifensis TaxID=228006 RepID=A0A318K8N0_9NOCA|nr:SRPBCC family protein [Nocardia tenerifensis]PXX65595.1 polyketide cyclase/dehydrase/lipid transport protein [Nocardia tenerifensis]
MIWLVIAVVLLVLALAAVVASAVLRRWTKTVLAGGGNPLRPVRADELRRFIERKAAFVVTTEQTFDAAAEHVWAALDTDGLFSWLPVINGMRYRDQDRTVGVTRVFDGFLVAGAERAIVREQGRRLAFTAISSSVPFVLKSIAEEYVLTPTDSGATTLTWTLAAHPRFALLVPYRLFVPLARPVARWNLRGLATRM